MTKNGSWTYYVHDIHIGELYLCLNLRERSRAFTGIFYLSKPEN
jgi:hypothetical protein